MLKALREVDMLVALTALLAALSVYTTASLADLALNLRTRPRTYRAAPDKSLEEYSFIGHDIPRYLPLTPRKVLMPVEESVRYSLDNPEAYDEWLWTAPIGDNHVRLGPQYRFLALAKFHQMHCLRGLRAALAGDHSHGEHLVDSDHLAHCLNYVRQWTLCQADVTLEPGGDFAERDFEVQREGATYVCEDWEPIYDQVGRRWMGWEKYRNEHGIH